ncbi:MAG: hypothetical protein ACRELF_27935 [Gemmataceae bacterium]
MTATPLVQLARRLHGIESNARISLKTIEGDAPIGWKELLDDIGTLRWSIGRATDAAVIEARKGGLTWEVIGSALEMTKQGAQQYHAAAVARFAKIPEDEVAG